MRKNVRSQRVRRGWRRAAWPRFAGVAGVRARAAIVLLVLSGPGYAAGCAAATPAGSIGAVLSHDRLSGELSVHDAPVGLAGESAGLLDGDRVKMIEGVLVDELDGDRIRQLLRGPVGTAVTLTVLRGDDVVQVRVVRQPLGASSPVAERHERIE